MSAEESGPVDWARFQEAFIHTRESRRVLGHRLRPFTFYHLLYLRDILRSPVIGGGPVSWSELEVACLVCRSRFDEIPDRLSRRRRWRRWARWWPGRWWRALRYGNAPAIRAALREMQDYLLDYYAEPNLIFATPEGSDKTPDPPGGEAAPPVLMMVTDLLRLGFSRREAWDCPVGEGLFYRAAAAARDGRGVRFVTPEEEKRAAWAAELSAQIKARKQQQKLASNGSHPTNR